MFPKQASVLVCIAARSRRSEHGGIEILIEGALVLGKVRVAKEVEPGAIGRAGLPWTGFEVVVPLQEKLGVSRPPSRNG